MKISEISSTRTFLQIPPSKDCIEPTKLFARSFAKEMQLENEIQQRISTSVNSMLEVLIKNAESDFRQDHLSDPLSMQMELDSNALTLSFKNSGRPLLFNGGNQQLRQLIPDYDSIIGLGDEFTYQNNGREGQSFSFSFSLKNEFAKQVKRPSSEKKVVDEVIIRPLEAGEEVALSRLFHKVYGYNYIHDYVYFPENSRLLYKNKQ